MGQVENRLSIGPRLGVNFSSVDLEGTASNTGLVAGLTSTYSINERFGLTIDLLYSAEGYQLFANEIEVNYFSLPILYNAFFGQLGEKFRPKIYIGVAPNVLLQADVNDNDLKDQFESFGIDGMVGLGFNYRLANRIWLNTDLRGALGLIAVQKLPEELKSRKLQLSVGIAYGL
ncbi:MAG: porin family protein [Bacteroidota bacterium]